MAWNESIGHFSMEQLLAAASTVAIFHSGASLGIALAFGIMGRQGSDNGP